MSTLDAPVYATIGARQFKKGERIKPQPTRDSPKKEPFDTGRLAYLENRATAHWSSRPQP